MFTRVSLSLSSVRRVLAAATSASTRRMKSTKFNVPLCAGVATAASLCAWQLTSPVSFGAPVLTESGHPGPMVDAVARAMPAVVRIMGRAPGRPVGSGFLISDDGYVVSNHHVVVNMRPEVCAGIEIHFESGDVYMAELVASDPRADVAVLKILPFSHDKPLPKFQYLKPGRSSQLVRGEWVAALGAMLGGLLTFSQGVFASSMYVVDDHTIDTRFVMVGQDDQNLLQIDATIVQGNSGGPIVNAKGVVVGIAVMGKMAMGGLGSIAYAVSIDQAWPIVQQLIADGTAKRARIGMAFRLIRAAMDGLDALPDGVLTAMMVDDVAPRSPAAVAGLHRGDVILQVNGKPATWKGLLFQELGPVYEPNKSLTLTVARRLPGNRWQQIPVTIKPIPDKH